MSLLFLSPLVVDPARLGELNVIVLAFLGAATEQYHKRVSVPAEVNALARTKVDLEFIHARANTLRF